MSIVHAFALSIGSNHFQIKEISDDNFNLTKAQAFTQAHGIDMKHFLKHLLQELLKLIDELPPKDPYEEWKDRVKKADKLTTEERKRWNEEQEQMWKDYWEGLL